MPEPAKPAGDNGAKADKPVKDVQLDKAIEVLEHWNKYKVQLAKADNSAPAPLAANQ